jgi:predicted glycosyltransferase involved in capsule biosynthesis
MQKYGISYIIGYKHRKDRIFNLRKTIDWVNSFSNVEIILVEQDKHSKISELNLDCKHIFIKSNQPFNRSWAFNVGTKRAKSNIIVFADSDLVMKPQDFVNGVKALESYEMVSPYNSVIDLTQEESNLPFDKMISIDRPGRGETDHQKIQLAGGISIFRKSAIEKIAGWNESFLGWGGEDDFQSIKIKNFLTWHELEAKCFHLWHFREQPDINLYQRNLQILQQAQKLTKDELAIHINNTIKKIGIKNLYDN